MSGTCKKMAAVAAATAALVAPIGVAQATHESGKAGAPGQVCKPLLEQRKAQIAAAREAGSTNAAIKELRKTQQAAYKGCVKAAATARGADRPAE